MNIDYILEFGAVVKHGNLSSAAIELNTTQSALSRHIAALEKDLGAELFDRATTPMKLTRMGEMMLNEGNVLACECARIKELAAKIRRESATRISMAGLVDSLTGHAVRSARDVAQEDGLIYQVSYGDTSTQTPFHLLREGALDIVVDPVSSLIDVHGLEHRHLFYEEAYLVVSRSSEHARLGSVDVDILPGMSFKSLRSNSSHAARKHLQQICLDRSGCCSVPKRLTVDPYAASYGELFLNGLQPGEAIMLPRSLAKCYGGDESIDYVAIPVTGEGSAFDFHVFYVPSCRREVRKFVDYLVKAASLGLSPTRAVSD